ncbi:uncharacterized protein LOC121697281 [Alosa sapidissima]|uniref:uncharacterized protein LOC121697281 n=1 Tax=Alosa sapidissima TaxID=34773 RepID=UPI001C08FE98|nr:uncharacterized protein LOC121697281 [Alosa sapidissima]
MASAITKATQRLSKASDGRDDTKLLMQPYTNWEEYLTPGPLSIAIMGELVFISSNVDFSINKNPPKDGFKHIRYPESFRACLMQVCNAGWAAFNEAHKNMDQIRLYTGNVAEYIKVSVTILLQDNDELIQTLLPDQLENIDHMAQDCLQLAERTEKKFMKVIELIQELLEACTNAKQSYGEELENVKRKIEEAKLRKQASDEANTRAEKAIKEMDKQLSDAQMSFNESMDSLPTGWEIIGMNLVEGLSSSVTAALQGVVNTFTGGNLLSIAANQLSSTTEILNTLQPQGVQPQRQATDPFAANNIFSKSSELLTHCESLKMFVDENRQINETALYDQKRQTANSNFQKSSFERILSSIKSENECEPKALALQICEKGIILCVKLGQYVVGKQARPELKPTSDQAANKLISLIEEINGLAQSFDSKGKCHTNTAAFTVKPPQLSKSQASGPETNSASQIATDNARLRIEQSRAQLDMVREMYQKSVDNMEKNKRELTEILVTMRNCEVKEIDFNTTIKMLMKGLEAMGRVKEQWEKMVRFFQMVSNIVKTCLSTCLNNFLKTATKASNSSLMYSSRMFMKDMIYNQAFQASNIASLVNMISGTYAEVSAKYLMDRVSSLGRLMALDPNNPQFKTERLGLQTACEEAQDGIRRLVLENKRKFEMKTQARLKQIEGDLLAVMPPPREEETNKVKEIVQSAFKDKEKEEQFA